jgi:uncharacterized membrane protein YfcA
MVFVSDRSVSGGPATGAGLGPAPRWPLWLFRVVVTVEAVLAFDQAVFAGQFISGDYGALNTHAANASVVGVVLLVEAVAALLLWRRGRGPGWPALAALGLFLLTGAQIGMGYARILAVHIPLGVTIIALDVLMLVWCWRYRQDRPSLGAAPTRDGQTR